MASRLLQRAPLLTNAVIVGSVTASGDVLAQTFQQRHGTQKAGVYDWRRTALMGSWGFVAFGPFWASWYRFLDHRLPARNLQTIGVKVIVTAVTAAPLSNALYFSYMMIGERAIKNELDMASLRHEIGDILAAKLIPTAVAGAKVWVPSNTINWLIVPAHLRTVFSSAVSVAWNAYLSLTLYER